MKKNAIQAASHIFNGVNTVCWCESVFQAFQAQLSAEWRQLDLCEFLTEAEREASLMEGEISSTKVQLPPFYKVLLVAIFPSLNSGCNVYRGITHYWLPELHLSTVTSQCCCWFVNSTHEPLGIWFVKQRSPFKCICGVKKQKLIFSVALPGTSHLQ